MGLLLASTLACAAEMTGGATPHLDKPKLDAYLRYIEAYTDQVKLIIDDPVPTAYAGYSRVLVHIKLGERTVSEKVYYVSADGEHFFGGPLWDLKQNPFVDVLDRLPANGFAMGPAEAKVTIHVFSDFECPYCRDFAKTLRDNIEKKYANDVRVIFHNFPLESVHPWARSAAEAADCLGNEKVDAFWAFHNWIFDHQPEVNDAFQHKDTFAKYLRDQVTTIAKAQQVDEAKVGACIDHHSTAGEVEHSIKAGQALQIETTPTLYINGRTIPGAFPWKTLDAVMQIELNRPKEIPAPNQEKGMTVSGSADGQKLR